MSDENGRTGGRWQATLWEVLARGWDSGFVRAYSEVREMHWVDGAPSLWSAAAACPAVA